MSSRPKIGFLCALVLASRERGQQCARQNGNDFGTWFTLAAEIDIVSLGTRNSRRLCVHRAVQYGYERSAARSRTERWRGERETSDAPGPVVTGAAAGSQRTKEKGRDEPVGSTRPHELIPAATYSPTHLRMQYHRRWQA